MPPLIFKDSGEFSFNLIPTGLEITLTENCNLGCDYCFVDKSCNDILTAETAIQGLKKFISLPVAHKCFTYNSAESLMRFREMKEICDYIHIHLKDNPDKKIDVMTTNGLILNHEHISFLRSRDLRINISIDGMREYHDSHRITSKTMLGTFDKIFENIKQVGKDLKDEKWYTKDDIMVIMTVSKENIIHMKDNFDFLLDFGFTVFDIVPNMLHAFTDDEIKLITKQMLSIAGIARKKNLANGDKEDGKITFRWQNRMWGKSCYSKILMSPDGNFYLFDCISMLPHNKRAPYKIGDTIVGIDMARRELLFRNLDLHLRTHAKKEYEIIFNHPKIYFPMQLYLWSVYHQKRFSDHFRSFMGITELYYRLSEDYPDLTAKD